MIIIKIKKKTHNKKDTKPEKQKQKMFPYKTKKTAINYTNYQVVKRLIIKK